VASNPRFAFPFVEIGAAETMTAALVKLVCGEAPRFFSYSDRPALADSTPVERRPSQLVYDRGLSGDLLVGRTSTSLIYATCVEGALSEASGKRRTQGPGPQNGASTELQTCFCITEEWTYLQFYDRLPRLVGSVPERFFGTRAPRSPRIPGRWGFGGEEHRCRRRGRLAKDTVQTGNFQRRKFLELSLADSGENKGILLRGHASAVFHNRADKGAGIPPFRHDGAHRSYTGREVTWEDAESKETGI